MGMRRRRGRDPSSHEIIERGGEDRAMVTVVFARENVGEFV